MKYPLARRRAFTLIEILVVIGIIALLGALLFPVFARVREEGRKTSCLSNMKQLGLAFQQYEQDSRGKYPRAGQLQSWANGAHWVTGGQGGTPTNYTGLVAGQYGLADPGTFATIDGHEAYPLDPKSALASYTKSAAIYVCPSAPDGNKRRLSYSMNCAVAGLSTTRIRNPSQIVLLVDEGKTINDGYFWAVADTNSTDALFDGHNGGGNLLYADGHVKFFQSNEVPADFKTRQTGEPRFHDAAFGPLGSSVLPLANGNPPTVDTCNRTLTATPTPAPTPTS